jgi:hypothetical protein
MIGGCRKLHNEKLRKFYSLPSIIVQVALSPGVKRPGRVVDHSPPTSAEVKKIWIYTYIHSPIRLHGILLNELNTGTILQFTFITVTWMRR